jgi:hypothetical protein
VDFNGQSAAMGSGVTEAAVKCCRNS